MFSNQKMNRMNSMMQLARCRCCSISCCQTTFHRQQVKVQLSVFAGSIVGYAVRADSFGFKVSSDVDRHLAQLQLPGSFESSVPGDDDAVGVNDDRFPATEFIDVGDDRNDGVIVNSRVAFVGH